MIDLTLLLIGILIIMLGVFLKDLLKLFTSNTKKLNPKYMNDANSTWETTLEIDKENKVIIKSYQRYYNSRYY